MLALSLEMHTSYYLLFALRLLILRSVSKIKTQTESWSHLHFLKAILIWEALYHDHFTEDWAAQPASPVCPNLSS